MPFDNVYGDAHRAASYARLEFPGTYYLAYRDLPAIIDENVFGKMAIDFGCGTGRSTRFLKKLGFNAVGVDISEEMVINAKRLDETGKYHVVEDGDLSRFRDNSYDLVLSAFTFDNIPTTESKLLNLTAIHDRLNHQGVMINLVSSPDIYLHEWASFSTRNFPENHNASDGDAVRIIMKDIDDKRPVEDILYTDQAYQELYRRAKLSLLKTYKPLAKDNEPFEWITETRIAPWVIYVLKKL